MQTLSRLLTTRLGSAAFAAATAGPLGVGLTFLGANVLGDYGYALFLAVPFELGLVAALVHGWCEPRGTGESIAVSAFAVAFASLAVLGVSLEGAICLVMAAPLALALGTLGGLTGHRLQRHGPLERRPRVLGAVLMLAPALLGADSLHEPERALRAVTTTVVVDARPGVVWKHVVTVDRLPEPSDLVFRVGIAYPTQATISGSGVGAVRRCTFTTGDFVEPITAWEPGRRLAFDVVSQPEPMRELSPWNVRPPHLDGFLRSERGQFELVPLAGGRTLLRGTTWYRNRMWPARYWSLWSDAVIHRVHERVLTHVAAAAEAHGR